MLPEAVAGFVFPERYERGLHDAFLFQRSHGAVDKPFAYALSLA